MTLAEDEREREREREERRGKEGGDERERERKRGRERERTRERHTFELLIRALFLTALSCDPPGSDFRVQGSGFRV